MRQFSRHEPTLHPPTALALRTYLQRSCSRLSVDQAVSIAVDDWRARQDPAWLPGSAQAPVRGYQWKELFLPEGTVVRLCHAAGTDYAQVTGERLMFRDCPVSPRQFALAAAGHVRNPWRDLWVRLPAERSWQCAAALRRLAVPPPPAPPPRPQLDPASPAGSMQTAAACMADALQTTLALVDQFHRQALRQPERRATPQRRASDRLGEDCSFD